jgi:hypothetical protein
VIVVWNFHADYREDRFIAEVASLRLKRAIRNMLRFQKKAGQMINPALMSIADWTS